MSGLKPILALAAILAVSIQTAESACYRPMFVGGPPVCQPTYAAPTYVAPAYTTPATYDPPVEHVVYRDNIIPVAYPVPFTVAVPVVSYLYQGGSFAPVYGAQPAAGPVGFQAPAAPAVQPVAQPSTQPSAELSDAQIDRIIDRIEKRLGERQNAQPGDRPPPVPGGSSIEGRATSILALRCAACHTGAASKGNTQIFLSAGVLNPKLNRGKVQEAADTGQMPPAAQKDPSQALSGADVAVLSRWSGVVK